MSFAAGRAALFVLAVVVAGGLAYELRGVSLDADGVSAGRTARSAAQVSHALSLFDRGAEHNADPTPRIDEAQFMLSAGRTEQAIRVLTRVAAANPGNLQVWYLLASAADRSDPAVGALANRHLFALFGHPLVYDAVHRALFSPTGEHSLAPGRVNGYVDGERTVDDMVRFTGWSAVIGRASGHRLQLTPANAVLIVANGRFVGGATPLAPRPDVARDLRLPSAPVGFSVDVPTAELTSSRGRAAVQIFGSADGVVSQLAVDCHISEPYGCAG